MRPSFIEVDLSILSHNLKLINEHIDNRPLMAVVKSNAYGHGLVRVAHLYEQLGVNSLGVALLEEGIILRRSGISLPIVVFGGVLKEQIPELLKWDLEFIVPSNDVLSDTEKFCKSQNRRATVHLKIDSGMGRIGVIAENSESLIVSTLDSEHINIKGVCSHFACADDPEDPNTLEQIDRFLEAVSVFEKLGTSTPLRHIANSGGVLYFPQSHLDIVRPGIILYGVYPEPSCPRILELKPALKLKSKVSFHKSIPPGFSISYGATWTSESTVGISTIPLGYGDGYPRQLSNRGEVLINGKRRPIVGRVCMDQFMVNCKSEDLNAGAQVILIGEQDGQCIAVEEISKWAETIPYEILTNLNERLPRTYEN